MLDGRVLAVLTAATLGLLMPAAVAAPARAVTAPAATTDLAAATTCAAGARL